MLEGSGIGKGEEGVTWQQWLSEGRQGDTRSLTPKMQAKSVDDVELRFKAVSQSDSGMHASPVYTPAAFHTFPPTLPLPTPLPYTRLGAPGAEYE